MSIKTAITAMLLLSATTLPALAEDFAGDPARPDALTAAQQPLFGGVLAAQPGTAKGAAIQPTRKVVSNSANAITGTDAVAGSSVPAFSANPHMYNYLSGPEYQGGA